MTVENLAQRYHVLPEQVLATGGRLLRHVAIVNALQPEEEPS